MVDGGERYDAYRQRGPCACDVARRIDGCVREARRTNARRATADADRDARPSRCHAGLLPREGAVRLEGRAHWPRVLVPLDGKAGICGGMGSGIRPRDLHANSGKRRYHRPGGRTCWQYGNRRSIRSGKSALAQLRVDGVPTGHPSVEVPRVVSTRSFLESSLHAVSCADRSM
jgi:hypothetical protein